MSPRRIIIDTDPGKDDAVAIMLALASPELEVLAVLAVHGNVPLANTERNARALLELANRPDVPVFRGCPRPLLRPPVHAAHVHGDSGLRGLVLPEPATPAQHEHAVSYLVRTLREAPPGSVTLCLLGPATNLAAALVQAPDIAERIAEIVFMAGAIDARGNVTAAAEFNVYADPHAARIVLESGARITLVPLDLTRTILLTERHLARLRQIGSPAASALAVLFEADDDAAMHDPCVIAHLVRPEMFHAERLHVAVETEGTLTMGMTVADRRSGAPSANATALASGDADEFFDLLFSRL